MSLIHAILCKVGCTRSESKIGYIQCHVDPRGRLGPRSSLRSLWRARRTMQQLWELDYNIISSAANTLRGVNEWEKKLIFTDIRCLECPSKLYFSFINKMARKMKASVCFRGKTREIVMLCPIFSGSGESQAWPQVLRKKTLGPELGCRLRRGSKF